MEKNEKNNQGIKFLGDIHGNNLVGFFRFLIYILFYYDL